MTTNSTLNLSHLQETVEDSIKNVRRIGRKSVMAYVGLWGLAYDVTIKDRTHWLAKAEKRGERIEKDMTKRVTTLRHDVEQRVNEMTDDMNGVVEKLQSGLKKFVRPNGATEMIEEIEVSAIKGIEELAEEAKKSTKATATTVKKAVKKSAKKVETAAETVVEAVEKLEMPFEEYDTLAWNQIVARVESMDYDALVALREYEMANRKRPSILKAVNTKLESPVV